MAYIIDFTFILERVSAEVIWRSDKKVAEGCVQSPKVVTEISHIFHVFLPSL